MAGHVIFMWSLPSLYLQVKRKPNQETTPLKVKTEVKAEVKSERKPQVKVEGAPPRVKSETMVTASARPGIKRKKSSEGEESEEEESESEREDEDFKVMW